MNDNPLISIIIPLYNKEDCILKTLRSIITQDFDDYEIVVVDDGSTDKGLLVVQDLANSHIVIIKKKNGGPSSARNHGVKNASGKYGMFLDADDTLEKGALKHLGELIHKESKCEFFCCNHYVQINNTKTLFSYQFKEGYIRNNFYAYYNFKLRPRAGAALYSMSLLKRYQHNEQLWRFEDADFIFNIMRNTRAYTSPKPIMTYYRFKGDASKEREDINEDFLGHLSYEGKGCWEQLVLYNLYLQGCKSYPNEMKKLYNPHEMYNLKVRCCLILLSIISLYESKLKVIKGFVKNIF